MPIKILAYTHPLRDAWVEAEAPDGMSIREIVGDVSVHAWVNGVEVPAEFLAYTRPKSGTALTVRPVPQGDNLRLIALIAVSAVAIAVSGGALGVLGTAFAAGGWGAIAGGAAIGIAGSLLVNTLIPPQVPIASGGESFNRLEALTGVGNRIAAFQPVPRLYGEFRIFPPIPMTGAPYTEVVGSDQYLRMMLVLGYGPLEIGGIQAGGGSRLITEASGLTGTPIKIGETDIALFEDVEFEIGDPADITLYSNQVVETNPGWTTEADVSGIDSDAHGQWVTDGDSAIRTTEADADEISIDIAFPAGLFCVGKKGDTDDSKVEWAIDYRLVGAPSWTVLISPWSIESSKKETLRIGKRWKVDQGQYEVRLTRIRTWNNDFEGVSNQATWTALRTIRHVKPFVVPNTVVMALRIKATDQINGRLDNVSVEATSILPVWNGSAWVDQATRVPAWIYADILTGTANGEPLDKSKLDTTELTAWETETNAAGRYFDGVFDSNGTVFDRIQTVATTGRASFTLSDDAKVSVVRDTLQTTPKMVISPRNSFGFSSSIAYVKPPHAYRVRFIDPTTYEDSERIVYDDGYTSANATKFEVLQTKGVKDADQAWKDGRYHLAQMRLRPETFVFSQDVQHLRYRRGDLLSLRHDVILVGLGAGRVKSVVENLIVTSGPGVDMSVLPWTYNASEVTSLGVPEGGWYRVTHVGGSSGGSTGIRGYVDETALIDNDTYTVSIDCWNDGLSAVTVHLDWCDQGGVSEVIQPGEQRRIYTSGARAYDATFRYLDICPQEDGASILLLNPQVTHGTAQPPFTNGMEFESDEKLFMEAGKSYGVKAQISDGSISTVGITTVSPYTTSVTLASAVSGLQAGDHFVFGESGSEAVDVKVSKIEPRGEFIAQVTCVPAAPNILDAETGVIPAYVPVLTKPVDVNALPPPVPAISYIKSDESVLLRDTDGSLRIRLVVMADTGSYPGSGARVQARYRKVGDTTGWSVSGKFEGGLMSITDVDQGRAYDVQVRAVRGEKVSGWSTSQQHTIIGKSSLPTTVVGFAANAARDRIELSWTENPEADISHYLIRQGVDWTTGTQIARTDGTRHQTKEPRNGPWWIKAVDTSGNESLTAAQATISPTLPAVTSVTGQVVDNNVLLKWVATTGTFDLATFEIRKGDSFATADAVGDSDKTFDVVFELAGGTYTYWIVPIDAAGNEGTEDSITLAVAAPPDFVLYNSFQTDWEGFALSNIQPQFSVPLPARLTTRDQTAIDGDGVDDYVQVPDSASINITGSALTIEGLVYFKSEYAVAFLNREESYELLRDGNGSLSAAIYTTAPWVWVDSGLYIPLGRWAYFAVVYDGTNMRFHVDDQTTTVAHPNGGAIQSVANTLEYLCRNPGTGHQAMRMAELRMWNIARTSTQINDWRDRTLDGNETGLVLYHRAQGGSGVTLSDKSGNGNDGSIVGASWHAPNVRALIPFPTAETVADRETVHLYTTPQAQIDAGFPYVAQPVPTTASFEEIYDAGAVIASTKVTATLAGSDVVAGVTSQITLSTRKLETDPWTDHTAGQTSVFVTDFRYIKVKVDYSGDGSAFRDAQDINTVLSTKVLTDSGKVAVSANPTTVTLNASFVDVQSITATPQGTTAKLAMVDFADVPNPTSFDIHLFDAAGNAATGDVRWSARGF